MHSLVMGWVLAGVGFAILELLTATLYGASLSIGAFVAAIYVWITGDADIRSMQALIFLVVAIITSIVLPRFFNSLDAEGFKTGLDAHIGSMAILSKVGEDFKVKIDGVDYLVDDSSITPEFASRKKVRINGHKSGLLLVSLVAKEKDSK